MLGYGLGIHRGGACLSYMLFWIQDKFLFLLSPPHSYFSLPTLMYFLQCLKFHLQMISFGLRPLVMTLIKMEIKKSVPLGGSFKLSLLLEYKLCYQIVQPTRVLLGQLGDGGYKSPREGELGGTQRQILFSSQFFPGLASSVQLWTKSLSFSTQSSKIRMALAFPCICSALSSVIFPWTFLRLSWRTCYLK